jgi:hypothetical protein
VSYVLIDGPNDRYRFSSYFQSEVKTGMTSFQLNYVGGKVLRFHDGQTIRCNIPSDTFWSVVAGTIYR